MTLGEYISRTLLTHGRKSQEYRELLSIYGSQSLRSAYKKYQLIELIERHEPGSQIDTRMLSANDHSNDEEDECL